MTDKCYSLILADPPWKQTKGGSRDSRPNQGQELDYETLSLAEISKHLTDVWCTDQSTLFLWTIDKFLFEAETLATELGYKRHARIIWDKENGVAPCFSLRYSHEYLLWMYKGRFQPVTENAKGVYTTVIRERSTKHSVKPLAAYELIEALYPTACKIELYARQRREGWDAWGNEV
jgi:N6-adenosine-specific RNA methylase IME4